MARPADRPDVTKKKFPSLLAETFGIVGAACKKAGISRETYYQWRRKDLEFAKICDETEIVTHSMVKDMLLQKIMEKDTTAIIFYCKTKMRNEGFVERIETTGKDGGPIEVQHYKTTETDLKILQDMQQEAIEKAKNLLTSAQESKE